MSESNKPEAGWFSNACLLLILIAIVMCLIKVAMIWFAS